MNTHTNNSLNFVRAQKTTVSMAILHSDIIEMFHKSCDTTDCGKEQHVHQ